MRLLPLLLCAAAPALCAPIVQAADCDAESAPCTRTSWPARLGGARTSCTGAFTTCSVPTFHSVGLYWRPATESHFPEAAVEYRRSGTGTWSVGHPLWHDGKGEYRGSVVHLEPNTTWDFRLSLPDGTAATIEATTWNETFPIKKRIQVDDTWEQPISPTESGSSDGYVLYEPAPGLVLDAKKQVENNILIDHIHGHFVIFRGFTMTGAAKQAILCDGCTNTVLEENVISDWGERRSRTFGEPQGAIQANGGSTLIIQRNLIRDPTYDSNSWCEDGHPVGPHGIEINDSNGNHVIRYNTITSIESGDDGTPNYYTDGITGRPNDSSTGFPNRDSDIYGNLIERVWDNPIEAEGGNRNVRIWGNYTNHAYSHIAIAPTRVGPVYIWRNLIGASAKDADQDSCGREGRMIKAGWQSTGRAYIYHNTALQAAVGNRGITQGIYTGASEGGVSNLVSRNNILQVRANTDPSIADHDSAANSYDYDLYNGTAPQGTEPQGKKGTPVYGPNDIAAGFYLSSDSPGYQNAVAIPNFSRTAGPQAPDIGAYQNGLPPLQFGITAYR